MKKLLTFLYVKWVKASCRNFCSTCNYKNLCDLYFVYFIQPKYEKNKSKLSSCYGMKVNSIFRSTGKNNRGN